MIGFNEGFSASVSGTVTNVDANNPVRIGALVLLNNTAAIAYLQMFVLAAASVTLGTTVPSFVIPVAANGSVVLSFTSGWLPGGKALSIAGTTTRGGAIGAAIDVFLALGGA